MIDVCICTQTPIQNTLGYMAVCSVSNRDTFKQVKGVVRFKLKQIVSDVRVIFLKMTTAYIKAPFMSITGSSSVCILL